MGKLKLWKKKQVMSIKTTNKYLNRDTIIEIHKILYHQLKDEK